MTFIVCAASGSRHIVTRGIRRLGAPQALPRPSASVLGRQAALSSSTRSSLQATTKQVDAGCRDNMTNSDPLHPDIPLSDVQLPLEALPPPIPSIRPSQAINRETLHRLHRLSALNPPPEGSKEETQLIDELNGLVGLMDLVKDVQLPEGLDMAGLLSEGRGEILLDGSHLDASDMDLQTGAVNREVKLAKGAAEAEKGRDLFKYATKTTGEYYSSKSNRKG